MYEYLPSVKVAGATWVRAIRKMSNIAIVKLLGEMEMRENPNQVGVFNFSWTRRAYVFPLIQKTKNYCEEIYKGL